MSVDIPLSGGWSTGSPLRQVGSIFIIGTFQLPQNNELRSHSHRVLSRTDRLRNWILPRLRNKR